MYVCKPDELDTQASPQKKLWFDLRTGHKQTPELLDVGNYDTDKPTLLHPTSSTTPPAPKVVGIIIDPSRQSVALKFEPPIN